MSEDQKDHWKTTLVYGWGRHIFSNSPKENKNSLNMSTACEIWCMPSRESARKPRENIETLNMDSRSRLSSIKLMEETDVSVQTYSFLEVTAVRYDEKPLKRWTKMWYPWYRDKKERTVLDSSTESISWRHNRIEYIARYMFPKYSKPFPS